ncbi:hypothetical protein BCR33DRAFT_20761 [Rhizoclosmatium globosum]|uniref:HCP-like protein n=1 Tax=Rhizoclosmatium globosum TaxID=329046 RepID=A0A1Y2CQ87_9FUNG|nr:hypothetical protein BCR33DRAFT_20761 [Rhizoclosmatium globosum]|eukprot:ORY49199.1 hypothetical protein BCR33DRAFT_20761 [Rhizoclosmatium globosum]
MMEELINDPVSLLDSTDPSPIITEGVSANATPENIKSNVQNNVEGNIEEIEAPLVPEIKSSSADEEIEENSPTVDGPRKKKGFFSMIVNSVVPNKKPPTTVPTTLTEESIDQVPAESNVEQNEEVGVQKRGILASLRRSIIGTPAGKPVTEVPEQPSTGFKIHAENAATSNESNTIVYESQSREIDMNDLISPAVSVPVSTFIQPHETVSVMPVEEVASVPVEEIAVIEYVSSHINVVQTTEKESTTADVAEDGDKKESEAVSDLTNQQNDQLLSTEETTEPLKNVDPVQHIEPVEHVEHIERIEPVESVQVVEQAKHVVVEHIGPVQPIETIEPVVPVKSVEPEELMLAPVVLIEPSESKSQVKDSTNDSEPIPSTESVVIQRPAQNIPATFQTEAIQSLAFAESIVVDDRPPVPEKTPAVSSEYVSSQQITNQMSRSIHEVAVTKIVGEQVEISSAASEESKSIESVGNLEDQAGFDFAKAMKRSATVPAGPAFQNTTALPRNRSLRSQSPTPSLKHQNYPMPARPSTPQYGHGPARPMTPQLPGLHPPPTGTMIPGPPPLSAYPPGTTPEQAAIYQQQLAIYYQQMQYYQQFYQQQQYQQVQPQVFNQSLSPRHSTSFASIRSDTTSIYNTITPSDSASNYVEAPVAQQPSEEWVRVFSVRPSFVNHPKHTPPRRKSQVQKQLGALRINMAKASMRPESRKTNKILVEFSRFCIEETYVLDPSERRELMVEVFDILKGQCFLGYAESQYLLGKAYLDDNQYESAYILLYNSALQTYGPACCLLASMVANGMGVPKDEATAVSFLKKGIKAGDVESSFRLGCGYAYGKLGLPIQFADAVRCLNECCKGNGSQTSH